MLNAKVVEPQLEPPERMPPAPPQRMPPSLAQAPVVVIDDDKPKQQFLRPVPKTRAKAAPASASAEAWIAPAQKEHRDGMVHGS